MAPKTAEISQAVLLATLVGTGLYRANDDMAVNDDEASKVRKIDF